MPHRVIGGIFGIIQIFRDAALEDRAEDLVLGEVLRGWEVVGGVEGRQGSFLLLAAVLHRVEVVREVLRAAYSAKLETVHLSFDARDHSYVCEMDLRASHYRSYVYWSIRVIEWISPWVRREYSVFSMSLARLMALEREIAVLLSFLV